MLLVPEAAGEALDGELVALHRPLALTEEALVVPLQGALSVAQLPLQLLQLVLEVLPRKTRRSAQKRRGPNAHCQSNTNK